MEKCIIVAVADNGAIGRGNDMPWHIAEDMKYFRRTTSGNPVIMGYRTFLSIGGRPLPKRMNIVISRDASGHGAQDGGTLSPGTGLMFAENLDEAFSIAGENLGESGKVFVMGGGKTYRLALPSADRLYVTRVHTVIDDADTFFPDIDPEAWRLESSTEPVTDPETGFAYEFTEYVRK